MFKTIKTNTQPKLNLAYSVAEIAAETSLSKPFIRNEIRAGRLKVHRFGRRVFILLENIEEYLRGKKQ